MSSRRPADTVAKLADYLWWLLPNFLKRKERAQSLVARLCDVWGEELGEGRTTLVEIIPLLLVETATGAWLDQLARARQIFRGEAAQPFEGSLSTPWPQRGDRPGRGRSHSR